jgi:hypothetical protein
MELLEICLKTTYFQVEDKFFQQKVGMMMGSSLSPVVSNIYMEHLAQLTLDTAEYKPTTWPRYMDDIQGPKSRFTERILVFYLI